VPLQRLRKWTVGLKIPALDLHKFDDGLVRLRDVFAWREHDAALAMHGLLVGGADWKLTTLHDLVCSTACGKGSCHFGHWGCGFRALLGGRLLWLLWLLLLLRLLLGLVGWLLLWRVWFLLRLLLWLFGLLLLLLLRLLGLLWLLLLRLLLLLQWLLGLLGLLLWLLQWLLRLL
jgi:hypothetical protein